MVNKTKTDKTNGIEKLYEKMASWLDDVKQHEFVNIVELIEKAKQVAVAAESLPEEKVTQFVQNLTYDLKEFYQLNQNQASHSIYLGILNETLWRALAKVTDQSQVEWAELCEDFDHDGEYNCGDVIGFGELECKNCHKTLSISHVSVVSECMHCQGTQFTRMPYHQAIESS